MAPSIECKNVRVENEDFSLGPVTLSFEPGTISALVGKNGTGKSTFFKLLMNLVSPTEGEITINGQSNLGENEAWKQRISYQPQTLKGVDSFTGKELKRLISNYYPTWDDGLFTKMVNQFGIPLSKPYGKLSQGVQKQLNLSLTIPRDTEILLLDEPFSGLDPLVRESIVKGLLNYIDFEKQTVVIATHEIVEVESILDNIVVLNNGNVIANLSVEDLREEKGQSIIEWMKANINK